MSLVSRLHLQRHPSQAGTSCEACSCSATPYKQAHAVKPASARAHSIALTGTPTCFWHAGEWELDDSKRLCVYMLERAISQLPEGQETVLGIFDLRGFKNKNADLGFVRFLVGC